MSRMPCLAALALGSLAALAAPADAFNARNGMAVTDLGNGLFRVEYGARADDTDYWCAAGDYALRVLGAPTRARLYRASAPPRKRGQGITFTLDPAQSSGPTGITNLGGPKDSLGVGHVTGSFCRPFRPFDDFW